MFDTLLTGCLPTLSHLFDAFSLCHLLLKSTLSGSLTLSQHLSCRCFPNLQWLLKTLSRNANTFPSTPRCSFTWSHSTLRYYVMHSRFESLLNAFSLLGCLSLPVDTFLFATQHLSIRFSTISCSLTLSLLPTLYTFVPQCSNISLTLSHLPAQCFSYTIPPKVYGFILHVPVITTVYVLPVLRVRVIHR